MKIYSPKLYADFNGLFGDILCLSHTDHCLDENGEKVFLKEGMAVTAFDEDINENGNSDRLIASGIVISSPQWLSCSGSKWALQIDNVGVIHESDIDKQEGST